MGRVKGCKDSVFEQREDLETGGGQCGPSSFVLGCDFEHHTKRSEVFPTLME